TWGRSSARRIRRIRRHDPTGLPNAGDSFITICGALYPRTRSETRGRDPHPRTEPRALGRLDGPRREGGGPRRGTGEGNPFRARGDWRFPRDTGGLASPPVLLADMGSAVVRHRIRR